MFETKFFIFKLKHLKGIGNKGLLRIVHYHLEQPDLELTVEECVKIGKVNQKYVGLFLESWENIRRITEEDYYLFIESYAFITILDEEYPEYLREIYNPPVALFYRGNIDYLKTPTLAIIGSRKATEHGKLMVDSLVPKLCENNLTIVSGLAKGNDTYAHQAAIRNRGKTIAVIGSGLNICYPKENERLQEFISNQHLILSEYLPNTRPLAYHFPSRNRIIAGISQAVCVIEAKKKSGTYITATLALEEGREVFSIPGNPINDQSEGCLQLIQDGAKCIWKAEDILEDWTFI
ncbi:MAG: DNA-processing protein DprA [Vagococcus sp.]|uniref:DNA-processing protein DprA n=1 Tax=Vagococcus sp. TaxID=1933889 RepID=UPI002FCB8F4B